MMASTDHLEGQYVPGAGDLGGHAYGQLLKSGMVSCEYVIHGLSIDHNSPVGQSKDTQRLLSIDWR